MPQKFMTNDEAVTGQVGMGQTIFLLFLVLLKGICNKSQGYSIFVENVKK
jgi:hypothetical protein